MHSINVTRSNGTLFSWSMVVSTNTKWKWPWSYFGEFYKHRTYFRSVKIQQKWTNRWRYSYTFHFAGRVFKTILSTCSKWYLKRPKIIFPTYYFSNPGLILLWETYPYPSEEKRLPKCWVFTHWLTVLQTERLGMLIRKLDTIGHLNEMSLFKISAWRYANELSTKQPLGSISG